jgi:hypothetical protein
MPLRSSSALTSVGSHPIGISAVARGRAPVRRALEARLQERLEPLRGALDALREAADELLAADDAARPDAWGRWATQLRGVFACADRCWPELDAALGAQPRPRRGWWRRLFRRRRA